MSGRDLDGNRRRELLDGIGLADGNVSARTEPTLLCEIGGVCVIDDTLRHARPPSFDSLQVDVTTRNRTCEGTDKLCRNCDIAQEPCQCKLVFPGCQLVCCWMHHGVRCGSAMWKHALLSKSSARRDMSTLVMPTCVVVVL